MMRREQIVVAHAIPGWAFRVTALAATVLGVATVVPVIWWQAAAVVAAVCGAIWPRTMLAWVGAVVMPIGLSLQDLDPVRTAVAVLVVHLVHVCASWSMSVPARAAVAPAALAPSGRRFLAMQAIGQVLAFAMLAVPYARGAGLSWAVLIATAGIVVVVGVFARLVSRQR